LGCSVSVEWCREYVLCSVCVMIGKIYMAIKTKDSLVDFNS
jgi:hypothetical protein